MAAEPKQKSIDLPVIRRQIPAWITPQWMVAERWRRVVDNQPVAAICEEAIIADLQDTKFKITAKKPEEEDALADDIEYYTNILNVEFFGAISGFDTVLCGLGIQDMLRLPMGGNFEIVRYNGDSPLSRPHEKGHVHKIVYIDGATLSPTFDRQFPIMQQAPEDATRRVFFQNNEIMRLIQKPRAEMKMWGYQMPPPEKIYLAIVSLYRGDAYYANLLLDTPEAGLLDLMDMSKQTAEQWLVSFRELLTGIDPFKIPVLYEHTKEAKYINFGRPPTELMFADVSSKYSRITHAGYGLTETDTGLGDPQRTLAGSIRDERRSRRSGFGRAREVVRVAINTKILPDYLEGDWVENDPESLMQRGKALVVFSQALKNLKDARVVQPQEAQAQLLKDGLITVELEEPEEIEMPPMLQPGNQDDFAEEETDKKEASEGGRGEISRADLGSESISAVPKDSEHFDQLAIIFYRSFGDMISRMETPRLMKLIKAATRQMFPDVTRAYLEIGAPFFDIVQELKAERLKAWFGEPSEFDDFPDILKANEGTLKELDAILKSEDWWKLDPAIKAQISVIMQMAYSEGATRAAEIVQEFLYTEGLRDSPNIIGLSFNLKNKRTLKLLEKNSAKLVTQVNDGTKFYLKRIITAGVDEGLSSPAIAQMIQEGATVEAVLKESGYTNRVIDVVKSEVQAMTRNRTASIVNTEINAAESEGRRGQWKQMGLTRKGWSHTGGDKPCPVCIRNVERGLIDIDMPFLGVFGEIQGPPGHPGVCHCHLIFDEVELMDKAGELDVWMGQ